MILDASDVIARANAGNGGNITIHAGVFVASAESQIDASSNLGIDGEVTIDSPNEITGSVIPLETPAAVGDALLAERCIPQLAAQQSTFTVEAATDAPAAAGGFLASPVAPLPSVAAQRDAASRALATAAPSSGCR